MTDRTSALQCRECERKDEQIEAQIALNHAIAAKATENTQAIIDFKDAEIVSLKAELKQALNPMIGPGGSIE